VPNAEGLPVKAKRLRHALPALACWATVALTFAIVANDAVAAQAPTASARSAASPRNLDSRLRGLYELEQRRAAASIYGPIPSPMAESFDAEQRKMEQGLNVGPEQTILVKVWTLGSPADVRAGLSELGAQQQATSDRYRLVETWLPASRLADAASLPGMLSLTASYAGRLRTGSVLTQGDAVVHGPETRANGVDGGPFLIGAMSDSALDLEDSQATGDLPDTVDRYLEFPATDEGRAMLEIIHDIAPGARLAHHSGILSELSFAEGITRLADAGARVIVDDIGYFTEPFFQDGIVAQAIGAAARDRGVLHVSAAGNEGDLGYEHAYEDEDAADAAANFHDFDPGPGVDKHQKITLPAVPPGYQSVLTIVLQWDDPFYTTDGVTSDFDAFLTDETGTVEYARSDTDNLAVQQPIEVLQWLRNSGSPTTAWLSIDRTHGSGPALLKYVAFGADSIDNYATHSATVFAHAASADVVAVGAVPFYDPGTIEPYSSRGNATIYFDAAGTRLETPEVRQKPDVVAPDDINTTFFGRDIAEDTDDDPNFAGTSAAAPHVAAVAALLLQANPHLTRDELQEAIATTAVDLGEPGVDTTYGNGLVDAAAAYAVAIAMPDLTPPTAKLIGPLGKHGWSVGRVVLGFSEPIDAAVAESPTAYVLREAGADGARGTADDVTYTTSAAYDPLTYRATLHPLSPSTGLGIGKYRVSIAPGAITDASDNALAGTTAFDFEIAPTGDIVEMEGIPYAAFGYDRPYAFDSAVTADGTLLAAYPNNPVIDRLEWPQVMIGTHDELGVPQGPYRSLPTDIWNSFRVESVDVSAGEGRGIVAWSDYEEIIYGAPDGFDIGYCSLAIDGSAIGPRQVALSIDSARPMPAVAMNAGGDAIIAVPALRETDNVQALQARRLLPSGVPDGDPFWVSAASTVMAPVAVAARPDGSAIVAWSEGTSLFARVYGATGEPAGAAFVVSAGADVHRFSPAVAMAPDGSFVIAWMQDAGDAGLFLQRYAPNTSSIGAPITVAEGDLAHPSVTYQETYPGLAVTMTADGRVVVAWETDFSAAFRATRNLSNLRGIFAQRIAADGTRLGCPTWVDEGNVDTALTTVEVGARDNGDFTVGWYGPDRVRLQRWHMWTGTECSDDDPCTERYCDALLGCAQEPKPQPCDPQDVCLGAPACPIATDSAELHVNTYTTSTQTRPSIASNASGDTVVAWQSYGQDGSGSGIYAQRLDRDGTPRGSEFRVNTTTTSDQQSPAVAVHADGSFAVAWHSFTDGSGAGVYAQCYDASGAKRGGEFRVNVQTAANQWVPDIAAVGDDAFIIVWQSDSDSGARVFTRLYANDGTPLTDESQVSTGTGVAPSVTANEAGEIVVVWATGDIFGRRLAADGTSLGASFLVNDVHVSSQSVPDVAIGADGRFVVAWQKQDSQISARLFRSNGVPRGPQFAATGAEPGSKRAPSAAVDSSEGFVIAWQNDGTSPDYDSPDGDGSGIFAQRFDFDGAPIGPQLQVNASVAGNQQYVDVAASVDGRFLFAWESSVVGPDSYGIVARTFADDCTGGTPCDDASACTSNDVCGAHTCRGGAVVDCDDGNVCTDDSCDSDTGCVHVDNFTPCNDHLDCTLDDVCSDGLCSGTPRNCNDGNPCTTDVCDEQIETCYHDYNTLPCDDGLYCTENDRCSSGACSGTARNCSDANACTDDACDETADTCTHINNAAPCDDGLYCTVGDACSGGVCFGTARNCSDANACTDDACNETSDTCTLVDNTAACDDGLSCTTNDHCDSGICTGTATGCGNGVIDAECAEECDDGDTLFTNGDYCDATCRRVPCGQPANPAGQAPKASDALFTLRVAVGQTSCDRRVCDVDDSGTVSASDALRILRVAVGQPVELGCPDFDQVITELPAPTKP